MLKRYILREKKLIKFPEYLNFKTKIKKMTSRSINLLACKIFASSMISISEDNQLKILEYSLSVLTSSENLALEGNITKMELQSTLKVYNTILNEFSNPSKKF